MPQFGYSFGFKIMIISPTELMNNWVLWLSDWGMLFPSSPSYRSSSATRWRDMPHTSIDFTTNTNQLVIQYNHRNQSSWSTLNRHYQALHERYGTSERPSLEWNQLWNHYLQQWQCYYHKIHQIAIVNIFLRGMRFAVKRGAFLFFTVHCSAVVAPAGVFADKICDIAKIALNLRLNF